MGAYLSVDLDFWSDYQNSRACSNFFKKIFNLKIPITFVIEHEELLPDMNKMKGLEILYNVDYHADIIAQLDTKKKPNDYDWANFVKGRKNAEFCWICPFKDCYEDNIGTCHADGDDPFYPQKNSGWNKCTWGTNLNLIEWKKVQRVGVCLSPCFVTLDPVQSVIKKLGMDPKKAEELIEYQPFNAKKRIRGLITRIAA